jgi:hypothetical protein
MRIRPALLSALLVAASALPLVAGDNQFTTTGTVVSTGRDSIVVRIDDHGHKIPFAIDAPTVLPAGIAVGSRVSVTYHPTGSTGQEAEAVRLLGGSSPRVQRSKTPAPNATAKKSAEKPIS